MAAKQRDNYEYTKLASVSEVGTRKNIYGVVNKIAKEPKETPSGKFHSIVLIVDETVSEDDPFRIHLFLESSDSASKIEVGSILRLHRVQIESFSDSFDGRIFSARDMVVFPGVERDNEKYFTSAKSVTFTDADKERLTELREMIQVQSIFKDVREESSNASSNNQNEDLPVNGPQFDKVVQNGGNAGDETNSSAGDRQLLKVTDSGRICYKNTGPSSKKKTSTEHVENDDSPPKISKTVTDNCFRLLNVVINPACGRNRILNQTNFVVEKSIVPNPFNEAYSMKVKSNQSVPSKKSTQCTNSDSVERSLGYIPSAILETDALREGGRNHINIDSKSSTLRPTVGDTNSSSLDFDENQLRKDINSAVTKLVEGDRSKDVAEAIINEKGLTTPFHFEEESLSESHPVEEENSAPFLSLTHAIARRTLREKDKVVDCTDKRLPSKVRKEKSLQELSPEKISSETSIRRSPRIQKAQQKSPQYQAKVFVETEVSHPLSASGWLTKDKSGISIGGRKKKDAKVVVMPLLRSNAHSSTTAIKKKKWTELQEEYEEVDNDEDCADDSFQNILELEEVDNNENYADGSSQDIASYFKAVSKKREDSHPTSACTLACELRSALPDNAQNRVVLGKRKAVESNSIPETRKSPRNNTKKAERCLNAPENCPGLLCAGKGCTLPGPVIIDDDDPRLDGFKESDLLFDGIGDIPAADEDGTTFFRQREYMPYGDKNDIIHLASILDFKWTCYRSKVKIVAMKPDLSALLTCGPKNLVSGGCLRCGNFIPYSQLGWLKDHVNNVKKPLCSVCGRDDHREYVSLDFRIKVSTKDAWGSNLSMYVVKRHADRFLGCTLKEYQESDEVRRRVNKKLHDVISHKIYFIVSIIRVNTLLKPQFYIIDTTLPDLPAQ